MKEAAEEFLKHAFECEQMARFSYDLQSKLTWRRMAERWKQCAERYAKASTASRSRVQIKRYGKQITSPFITHNRCSFFTPR